MKIDGEATQTSEGQISGTSLPHLRVLHFIETLGMGGTQQTLVRFIERTMGRVENSVCCIRREGLLVEHLRTKGISVFTLNKRRGNDWSLALRAARLCRRVQPHVVHTRTWGSIDCAIGAVMARSPAIVHSEHGYELVNEGKRNRRRHRMRRLLAPFLDRIVTVSEDLKRFLSVEGRIRPDKVTVIHNGVDVEKFRPLESRQRLREESGYRPEDFVIGTVSRLVPERGHGILVDALAAISLQVPDARLLIIGEGPDREALQQRVRDTGLDSRVRLLGLRHDVPVLLNLLDVFALSSLAEGTSNALLEAMAVGLPVVATRVGGNPEVVLDGATGQLVEANDPVAFADALQRYAIDERTRLQHGAGGRRRVESSFTVDRMVSGYLSVYENTERRRSVPPAEAAEARRSLRLRA